MAATLLESGMASRKARLANILTMKTETMQSANDATVARAIFSQATISTENSSSGMAKATVPLHSASETFVLMTRPGTLPNPMPSR